jgi:hypothetical protein
MAHGSTHEIQRARNEYLHTCCANEDIKRDLPHFILRHYAEYAFYILVVGKIRVGLQIRPLAKTHESPSWQPVRTQAFTAASWAVHADAAECSSKITERLMPRLHRKRKRLNKNSSSDGAYPCNKTTAALSSRTLAAYIARQFLWRTLTQREKGRRQASEREHVRLGIPSL